MADYVGSYPLGPRGIKHIIVLKDSLAPEQKSAGLYKVSYDPHRHELNVRRTDSVTTKYAAVNGIQNHLDRAALVMLDKVQATADLRRDEQPIEFTLFHVPYRSLTKDVSLAAAEKLGVTTADAKELSKVLKQTSDAGQEVVWSVHSRGATVFDAAVRQLNRDGNHVQKTSVAAYGGAAHNVDMKRDVRTAGVSMIGKGFFNHPYDLVPQIVGGNTRNPIKLVGSLYKSPAVFFSDKSPHTWHVALTPADYASVPQAQWAKPGTDLREQIPPPALAGSTKAGSAQDRSDTTGPDVALHQPPSAREPDPFPFIAAAQAMQPLYASASAEVRTKLLKDFHQSLKTEIAGPALTALPLLSATLNFVKGEGSVADLQSAAKTHASALLRAAAIARFPGSIAPDIAR